MTVTLDGLQMTDKASAHDHLKQQLNLPEYYGRNLDALYDLLTEISHPLNITLLHQSKMEHFLGSYGQLLLETLQQAADENPNLNLLIQ